VLTKFWVLLNENSKTPYNHCTVVAKYRAVIYPQTVLAGTLKTGHSKKFDSSQYQNIWLFYKETVNF